MLYLNDKWQRLLTIEMSRLEEVGRGVERVEVAWTALAKPAATERRDETRGGYIRPEGV